MPLSFDWIITIAAFAAAVAVFGAAVWQSGRTRKDSLRARWIPWKFVVLLAGAIMVYAAVHMMTLLGFKPGLGRPF